MDIYTSTEKISMVYAFIEKISIVYAFIFVVIYISHSLILRNYRMTKTKFYFCITRANLICCMFVAWNFYELFARN